MYIINATIISEMRAIAAIHTIFIRLANELSLVLSIPKHVQKCVSTMNVKMYSGLLIGQRIYGSEPTVYSSISCFMVLALGLTFMELAK